MTVTWNTNAPWNDVVLLEQYVRHNRALGRQYLALNRIERFDVIDGFDRGWRIFATSGDGSHGFPGADCCTRREARALADRGNAAIATLLQSEEVAS